MCSNIECYTKLLPLQGALLTASVPRALPWAKSFWAFSPYLNHFRNLSILFKFLKFNHLELCVLRSTWERNHVTDVLHTCNKENQALETETETSMRT